MSGVTQRYWRASTLQGRRWLMEKRLEAVELNDLAQLKQLLAAQNRSKPKELSAALEIAIMKRSDDYAECVKLLLMHGANPDGCNGSGTPFLQLAADMDCHKIVRVLIENHCDVNISKDGCQALHKVALQGHMTSLHALLVAKADVASRDIHGRTALLCACEENRMDAVSLLIASRSPLDIADNENRTVLYWAVWHGQLEFVEALVDMDCSNILNQADIHGVSPLMLAAWNGLERILGVLIPAGADLDLQTPTGLTALSGTDPAKYRGCIMQLLTAGCDVTLADDTGKTPLMNLVLDEGCVRLLLESGADPNASDKQGVTALYLATHHLSHRTAKLLIQYNADMGSFKFSRPDSRGTMIKSVMNTRLLVLASLALGRRLDWLTEYTKHRDFLNAISAYKELISTGSWFQEILDDFYAPREPSSLKLITRLCIRRSIGHVKLWFKVDCLMLPEPLKNYLKLVELDQYMSVNEHE